MDRVLVGRRIRASRVERGLSQEEFAKQVNLSTSTLSKIECGKGGMWFDTAERIADVLELDLDELAVRETLKVEIAK